MVLEGGGRLADPGCIARNTSYALTLAQHTVSSQSLGLRSHHCPQALDSGRYEGMFTGGSASVDKGVCVWELPRDSRVEY